MEHWNKLFCKNLFYPILSSILSWNIANRICILYPYPYPIPIPIMPWNIEHANRFLLLSYHQKCDYPIIIRVHQTLTPQVRLSAFGGPHDASCRRFHVPSADHIQNAFRHDAPRRRLVTDIPLARHTAAHIGPAALGR